MTNFQWVVTPLRKNLLDKIKEIPEYGIKSKSEIIEIALQEFILRHGDSNNPQSKITLFQSPLIKAIPTIYGSRYDFEKFYKLLNKKEYQELDEKLNMILEIHNGILH